MGKIRNFLKNALVTPDIERHIDNIPKPVGSFGYDPWGFNTESLKISMAVCRPIYEKYFRVTAHGLENVPKQGRVLIIANHSGQLPLDGLMIGYAIATNSEGPRAPRVMIERFFPTAPVIGNMLNELGAVVGDPINCVKMLHNEEAVIVFPEGVRGAGKPYRNRYKLARFGHGFMHLAIQENTPIIPVGVVGCEETVPSFGNIKPLAAVLGLPYFPLAFPWPLPAKVILNFGKPMYFTGDIDCEAEVDAKVEQVKDAIRELISKGLAERKGWFS
ncbi:MAG TPA: lysophospholipid acyltransferase family protein [Pseudomonadales bacterium]|nr:lysophospholipid acyltransferase family protein [Pseudomonadales bacterium]